MKRAFLFAAAFVLTATFATPASRADVPWALPEQAPVSTIAGSGQAGIGDGPASSAQFMLPTSVATDPAGNIFVCDFGAQRIREITPGGDVRTIAGGGSPLPGGLYVPGDRINGPAAAARFYAPAGIAVDAHDTVYVADSGVHVIRKIENGTVSTYAGNWDKAGDATGPATAGALFTRPVALALARNGDLYVADVALGIREVTRDGQVIVPDWSKDVVHPSGIALYEEGNRRTFAVADSLGAVYVAPDGAATRLPVDQPKPSVDGKRMPLLHTGLGYTFGIAFLGPYEFVYSDPRSQTIRSVNQGEVTVLAGESVAAPERDGGGFRDGPGAHALFAGPMGIAVDKHGAIIVADSNNRRIRRLGPFDHRVAIDPLFGNFPELQPHAHHVLLIGGSAVEFGFPWREALPGLLESELNANNTGEPVQVVAVRTAGFPIPAQRTYVEQIAKELPIDYAVFFENSTTVAGDYPNDAWVVGAARDLRAMADALPHPHNAVVGIFPFSWELGPSGATWHRFFEKIDGEWLYPVTSFHDGLRSAVTGSNLPMIDFWQVFGDNDRSAARSVIYTANEAHFAEGGNRLAAHTLAKYMLADPNWRAISSQK